MNKELTAKKNSLISVCSQMFLEEAEKDKERYMKELELYQQTESYKKFVAKQKAMKQSGQ